MSDFRWTWLDHVEADDSPLSPGARHLANVLVRNFVPKGDDVCWPGLRRLNKLMGTGGNSVARRFLELEHYGFLHTTRRRNGMSHLRQLLIPEPEFLSTVPPWVAVRFRGSRQTVPPWDAVSQVVKS